MPVCHDAQASPAVFDLYNLCMLGHVTALSAALVSAVPYAASVAAPEQEANMLLQHLPLTVGISSTSTSD